MGNDQDTPHKFDQLLKHPLTYRERAELKYTPQFIPFLKFLETKVGHAQVIQWLREFSLPGLKEFAEELVKEAGKNDLSVIKELYNPANPDLCDVLTMEVLEDTQDTYVVNVTECLPAEVFRKAGAADYGCAAICLDVPITELVNPQIGLELEKTLMEGAPGCLHRWYVKL